MSGSGLAAVHLAAASSTTALQVPPAAPQADVHSSAVAGAAASATTAADLAAAYPDFVAQIRVDAAAAERSRIFGIEAHAMAGHEALIAQMKADPAMTPDMAAGRLLAAERQIRASRAQAVVDVEKVTGHVAAAPAPAAASEEPRKETAHQLAARARAYQDEQSRLGVKLSVAQAVAYVEKNG